MEINEVKILLNRYYDGETTVDEERQLADYLATYSGQDDELLASKAMSAAFCTMREATMANPVEVPLRRRSMRLSRVIWYAAASIAVVVALFVGLAPRDVAEEPALVCYVNGELIDDELIAQAEASRILGSVFSDVDKAMSKVNRITGYSTVE